MAMLAFFNNLALRFTPAGYVFPFCVDSSLTLSDDAAAAKFRVPPLAAAATSAALFAAFMAMHSLLARPRTKRFLAAKLGVPETAERSLYCLQSVALLTTAMAAWAPVDAPVIWDAPPWARPLVWAAHAAALAFLLTAPLDSADLMGLRRATGRGGGGVGAGGADGAAAAHAGEPPLLVTRGHYALVRHPMQTGTVAALLTHPRMTAGHLALVAALSAYSFAATLLLEEADLAAVFGEQWACYAEATPALVPRLRLCPARGGAKAKAQ
ncbi:hypothetical protein JKP88DRAFT_280277 [Tribonema minus]|uniref:Nuclear envelope membrane protein n=1 Tax=Tribonema minus TaxID=303371 RepID=A0A836CBG4_9STRA|nr:hypothetical protein JKP88DRAFT_280277 [Tribonema minus]